MPTNESNSPPTPWGHQQNLPPTGEQTELFAEFLDDYFAESDALITNARRSLLILESSVDSNTIEPGLVEELLRSFHTLKGLSGMVGVREAEALAHEMESYLRTLREEKARLSSEGMDALMAGTQMLQQAVAARKEQTPPPNIDTTVARIQAILPPSGEEVTTNIEGGPGGAPIPEPIEESKGDQGTSEPDQGTRRRSEPVEGGPGDSPSPRLPVSPSPRLPVSRSLSLPVSPSPRLPVPPSRSPEVPPPPQIQIIFNNAETEKLNQAIASSKTLWHFQFTPNAELANKGINVNTIRSRLQELGEIIHASPRMLPTGSIVFDFILCRTRTETPTDFDPTAKEIITASGLSYRPFEAPTPPAATEDNSERNQPPSPVVPPPPSLPVPQSPSPVVPPSPSPGVPPSPSSPAPLSVMPANIVRVDLARLDELMQTLGELVISRARLEDRLKQLQETVSEKHLRPLQETNQQMERQLRELRAGMLRVRLVPISDVFTRMQFVVRDLARTTGKKVKVELIGQDTEIDKFVVERLMDPLLHLVRNAVSHGLETPLEREAKGKPPEGKVILRAATVGEMAVIEVEDDGKGIDAAEIIAKSKQMGLFSPEALDPGRKGAPDQFDTRAILSGTLLLDILCTSGFSTRAEADLTSGRGVGLAVVHRSVQELGGSITLDSQVGVKTKFRVQLPLTLAIADALLATAGGQTFAIPLSSVQEIIAVKPQDITTIAPNITSQPRWDLRAAPWVKPSSSYSPGSSPDTARLYSSNPARAEIIYHRGMVLPLLRLANFFNLSSPPRHSHHAFIIGFGDETNNLGIVVDRVIGQREIVVRPLTDALVNVPGISGATDLGDGRVVLILDAGELIRFRQVRSTPPSAHPPGS